MDAIFIKPGRKGLLVRDPITGAPLDPNGESKPRSSYWLRRLRDGDAVKATPPKKSASKATDSKGKE